MSLETRLRLNFNNTDIYGRNSLMVCISYTRLRNSEKRLNLKRKEEKLGKN